MYPRVLKVETGFSCLKHINDAWWTDILDYEIYKAVPRWWRRIEEKLRLDIVLAFRAKRLAHRYNIVWADSEKVGIPLTLMGIDQPIITVCQHMASPLKKKPAKLAGVAKKWAGMGYYSEADKDFMMSYFGITSDRLINCMAAPLDRFTPGEVVLEGPIMSLGVSKRDYKTMMDALSQLPGYETEVYVSSRYGDLYRGSSTRRVPEWIHFVEPVSDAELVKRYQRARFVVLPLLDSTQFAAGASVAVESGAAGKAVIASNTRGMSTYVKDGVTGLLVPPYDMKALQQAICKLWSNPELAYQMGMAGRKFMEVQFHPQIVDATIREFLLKVYSPSRSN